MTSACQNFVAGEGAGSSACEIDVKTSSRGRGQGHLYAPRARSSIHYPAPPSATKCPLFLQTQIWSPYPTVTEWEEQASVIMAVPVWTTNRCSLQELTMQEVEKWVQDFPD